MSQNAGKETPGSVSDEVVKRACEKGGGPIRQRMRESKGDRHDRKRKPAKTAKGNQRKFFRNQEAKEKAAPENFFNYGNHRHEAKEAQDQHDPVKSRTG